MDVRAILFDLDGTLLDTLAGPGLALAVLSNKPDDFTRRCAENPFRGTDILPDGMVTTRVLTAGASERDAVGPRRLAPERHRLARDGVAGRDRQAADELDGGPGLGLGHLLVADQVPVAALGVAPHQPRGPRNPQ